MKRAVVVFVEDNPHLLLQLGCLYTSINYIQSEDTDLVVFGTKEALNKIPSDCIKVQVGIADNPPEFLNYRFINSISCLAGEEATFLDEYDYILRTDADTFLTPAWNSYYPTSYTVGRGGYVNDQKTISNLKQLASKHNLRHQGFHNLGSTHYGNPQTVREVCKIGVFLSEKLLTEEFKEDEGKWPSWYKGVATMYGCEIAVNHLVDNIEVDTQNLDYGSASEDSIYSHSHIHCWHTDNMFSKFHFTAGNYDKLSIENLDINKIKDYCLFIALNSKKLFPLK